MSLVVCTYCGYLAAGRDHVIPYSYLGKCPTRRAGKNAVRAGGITVPACFDCNTTLGNKLIPAVTDRAYYILNRYKTRKRYDDQRIAHLQLIADDLNSLNPYSDILAPHQANEN